MSAFASPAIQVASIALAATLARWAKALAQEIRVRRDLRHLEALDDCMLTDIGLSRGGLEEAVRSGRPRRGRSAAEPARPAARPPLPIEAEWR